jgi:DNA-binding beta-propeller fold protein YncE
MRSWARWCNVVLLAGLIAAGCGGGGTSSPSVTVQISPTAVSVLLNNTVQFVAASSSTTSTISWSVNDTPGGNSTVGTIDPTGLYTAPSSIPANTGITVKATAQDTTATATATVTLVSGAAVSVAPTSVTMGTGETFPFQVSVSGVPTNAITPACNSANPGSGLPLCTDVTWSVSAGSGTVDANGVYTAPGTTGTATVTATSVYDTSIKASATVTISAAADPVITSVDPKIGAIGAVHQDLYLTGANFLSTTTVFINGVAQPSSSVLTAGGTLRVRVPAEALAVAPTPPSSAVTLNITAAAQNSTQQQCSPDPTQCQVVLTPTRPIIVGASPDSIPQSSAGSIGFNVNGGFFGTASHPTVTAQFLGQSQPPTVISPRQLSINLNVNPGSLSQPGLFPVALLSSIPGANLPPAVANIAVQPAYGPSAVTQIGSPLAVGSTPSAVAVNTATGIAVVANQGSNDITLIDLTQPTPSVVAASICTGSAALAPPCPAGSAAPTGVAVDNLRNIALVANSANNTVAVVNLATRTVAYIIPTAGIGGTPVAVGINPVTGRAIIVYRSTNNATLLDLTPWPASPVVAGTVGVGTGPNPRVTVSPRLDWALVSPGGGGSLSIVDLSRQTVTPISGSGASRTSGTVTITTAVSHGLQAGQPVLIQGVNDASFNGIFTVTSTPSSRSFTYSQSTSLSNATSGGGAATYSSPVANIATNVSVTGVAINDETGKAILVDPTGGVPGTIFNAPDQSSNAIPGLGSGYVGAGMNPLANFAIAVNEFNNQAIVIDPGAPGDVPKVLTSFSTGNHPWDVAIDPATELAVIVNQGDNTVGIFSLTTPRAAPQIVQTSPAQITVTSTLASPAAPVDQTLTIVGKNFGGGAVARLDGAPLTTLSQSDRMMTVRVPAALQTQARRFTLDVVASGVASNASNVTVVRSVDVSGTCSGAAPGGVALDVPNDLAVVTDSGCNDAYLVNLTTGIGQVVAVGTNPSGVAVQPMGNTSVISNSASNNVSILSDNTASVTATINTNVGPTGVAIDPILGTVVVAATSANVVNVFPLNSPTGTAPTSIAVLQGPLPVAVDPTRHSAAVGNATSNNVSFVDLAQKNTTQQSGTITFPQDITYDPVTTDFLVAASLENQVKILNVDTGSLTGIRVGINPTSIALNFNTATLVTTNSLGQSITVVDYLARQVRSVSRLTPASLFSVDIHPFTNIAVVADSTNKRILFLPVAR